MRAHTVKRLRFGMRARLFFVADALLLLCVAARCVAGALVLAGLTRYWFACAYLPFA